jgi:hypothetical protein
MLFSYHIVRKDSHAGQALESGSFNASDAESARRHAQTVVAPSVAGKSGLEVILQDGGGTEMWRGPYMGPT